MSSEHQHRTGRVWRADGRQWHWDLGSVRSGLHSHGNEDPCTVFGTKGALWFAVQDGRSGCVRSRRTGGQRAWKPAAVALRWGCSSRGVSGDLVLLCPRG